MAGQDLCQCPTAHPRHRTGPGHEHPAHTHVSLSACRGLSSWQAAQAPLHDWQQRSPCCSQWQHSRVSSRAQLLHWLPCLCETSHVLACLHGVQCWSAQGLFQGLT